MIFTTDAQKLKDALEKNGEITDYRISENSLGEIIQFTLIFSNHKKVELFPTIDETIGVDTWE